MTIHVKGGFPGLQVVKNLPANAEDMGLIPGLGRSPVGRHGNPLQYFCLENPVSRGAWWATVHGVAERHDWVLTEHLCVKGILIRSHALLPVHSNKDLKFSEVTWLTWDYTAWDLAKLDLETTLNFYALRKDHSPRHSQLYTTGNWNEEQLLDWKPTTRTLN